VSDKILNMLGMMRRANAIQIGETNTGAIVRGGKAKLLLLAADASDNAKSRAEGFARGRSVLTVVLPYTKDEISASVGLNGCSMAAVTDMGFANALMKALAAMQPDVYSELAQETDTRFQKAQRRKKEAAAHERNKRIGKRRTNV
jgi:ribosomal protein L7Ae-like RNA K-turn-binding protein